MEGFNIGSRCDSRVKMTGGPEMETSIATDARFGENKCGHVAKRCRMMCVVCGAKHIPLMCPKLEMVKPESCGKTLQNNKEKALANHSSSDTLLQMLIVRIKGKRGDQHIRALIDTGSQRSYITKELVLAIQRNEGQRKRECLQSKNIWKEASEEMWTTEYDVELPWIGNPPLPTNYHASRKHLENLSQPVIKELGTTKVRPVFDTSFKVHGSSLNDCLEEGPNLIEAIPPLLLQFRVKSVGVVADIKKALQISLCERERDRDIVRFLLKDKGGHVTALRHKRDCEVGQNSYAKETIARLHKVFYMDNCVTSVREDEKHTLIEESTSIFRETNFGLRGLKHTNPAVDFGEMTSVLGLLCSESSSGIEVNRIDARTRVAPTKKTTIPRFELLATITAARLASMAAGNLGIDEYFSHYLKIVGDFLGWVQRYVHNCQHPLNKKTGELGADEFGNAEEHLIKLIQKESFCGIADEYISSLMAFNDENGILRSKKRISEHKDTFEFRHPAVLPAVIQRCTTCKRFAGGNINPVMPPLPEDRVCDGAVFEVIGVDIAGPLYLKYGSKVWICIFTCAVYRDVRVKLVSSLSSEAFIRAVRRIIIRRGCTTRLHEDLRKRFRSENLGQLNSVSQYKGKSSITVGEVVLVGNYQEKWLEWPLAIVEELLPCRDGISRVIQLKTASGVVTTPIKLTHPHEGLHREKSTSCGSAGTPVNFHEGPQAPTPQQHLEVKRSRISRNSVLPSRYKN
ncbi:hypothetical protein PR048_011901, partial [Dryococelus australis]